MPDSVLDAAVVARYLDAPLHGESTVITAPAAIQSAGSGHLTFAVDVNRYQAAIESALAAGALVIVPSSAELPESGAGSMIPVENPRAAFARVVAEYFTEPPMAGIAATARIHPTAVIHETAVIGEFTVVRSGVVVGAHSEVRDHVVIGTGVRIGEHALIKSHAVIGEEGFGMEKDPSGDNIRIPHIGSVYIGHRVEVGCFTTVCAGTISPTMIGDHTKIDDHVHIAHNCLVGRNVIVTACAEISGSVIIEDDVWIGPNASVIDGVVVGKGALLGIGATAIRSIPEGEVRAGNPAKRIGSARR